MTLTIRMLTALSLRSLTHHLFCVQYGASRASTSLCYDGHTKISAESLESNGVSQAERQVDMHLDAL